MVTDTLENKSVKKTILTAIAVIGTSALLFMGLQAVSASEQEKVPSEQPVEEVPVEAAVLSEQAVEEAQVEAAVPSEQAVEEAPVKAVVPSEQPEEQATAEKEVASAQPEDDFASEAYLLNNR
jgi:hypothetical protein